MSPKKITPNRKVIYSELGRYYRALETIDYVYFVNYQESDENASVKMYSKETWELLSDNYFGYNDFFGVLMDKTFTYISPTMKYNLKLYGERYPEIILFFKKDDL